MQEITKYSRIIKIASSGITSKDPEVGYVMVTNNFEDFVYAKERRVVECHS